MPLYRSGHTSKSVSGQIDESLVLPQRKKVNELRPARQFAGARELPPVDDCVDGTRLSGIGTARNGDLPATISSKDVTQAVRDEIVALMSAAADLNVPLKVESGIGANWDEAH